MDARLTTVGSYLEHLAVSGIDRIHRHFLNIHIGSTELSNYAYYISQTGKNLQKAELMSYKTIKAEPKNSTYLDTYAWILFMEERYAEAKTYIDQTLAYSDSTADNSTIIEHAGDIYAMNGLTDQAVAYWKQAQKGSQDPDALKVKIECRKYMTESEIIKYKRKWKKTK